MAELTPEIRERRRGGLGGSDAPVVFGVGGWGSPFSLWASKVWATPDDKTTPQQQRGHDLETMIAEKVARKHGIRDLYPGGWVDHPEHGFMFANLDYEDREVTIIECKATDYGWKGYEWGPDGDPDGLPARIDFQAHHQLTVTGAELCIVGVLFVDTWELRTYEIKPDPELAALIVNGERNFWESYVIPQVPPPVTDGPSAWDALRALSARPDSSVDLPTETNDLIGELLSTTATRLLNEKREKHLKAEIGRLLGDAEHGYIDGEKAVEFKNVAGGNRRLNIPSLYRRRFNHGNQN